MFYDIVIPLWIIVVVVLSIFALQRLRFLVSILRKENKMFITCEITENHNNLQLGQNKKVVVVPNGWVDEFISALQRHCSSEGDGQSFTLGVVDGHVVVVTH